MTVLLCFVLIVLQRKSDNPLADYSYFLHTVYIYSVLYTQPDIPGFRNRGLIESCILFSWSCFLVGYDYFLDLQKS